MGRVVFGVDFINFTVEKVNSGTQVVPSILEFKTKILFSSHVVIILRNWLIVFITINHSDIKATAYPFQNFFCSSEINSLFVLLTSESKMYIRN